MQNLKSTPDSLKQIFKAFARKLSLGAPEKLHMDKNCSFRMRVNDLSHTNLLIASIGEYPLPMGQLQ